MLNNCLILGLVWSMVFPIMHARAQSVRTSDVTSGACMIICDDVSFCQRPDYDAATGVCTIVMNPADPGFLAQRSACPLVRPERWVISFANDRWTIGCPPGSTGPIPQAPPPPADPLRGLEDIR